MPHILTITMNPAIDISTSVQNVAPTTKMRCAPARRDPGGGGINVALVLRRFGVDVTALYPKGGSTGQLLNRLVTETGVRSLTIPIEGETREDFTAVENSTGKEFRFVMSGPELSASEWGACLETFAAFREPLDHVVISGSLPPGVPDDFYARLIAIARARSVPVALDAPGRTLKTALAEGVDILKPNYRELRELTGLTLSDDASCNAACRALIRTGAARVIALTLGSRGALLVTADGAWRAGALPVDVVSTVGAGDSFLGGILARLALGDELLEAFRYGVACGSAALVAPGTQLCHEPDVRQLLPHVTLDASPFV